MFRKYARSIILVISILTIVAGIVQVIAPGFVLAVIGGDTAPAPRHSFSIIGMFMALFGGVTIHSLYSAYPDRVVVLWGGLQKAGASIAVFIGIAKGLFSPMGALVAGFDLLSAVIFFTYLSAKTPVSEGK